jgi:hypothetical protein
MYYKYTALRHCFQSHIFGLLGIFTSSKQTYPVTFAWQKVLQSMMNWPVPPPPPKKTLNWKLPTYWFILICLLIFCGFSFAFFYVPSPFQQTTPAHISNPNITANAVTCGFPLSGQYGMIPITVFFVLVPLIILLRKRKWLSGGAAAWAMGYSAVSCVHLLVLFVLNNHLAEDPLRNVCNSVPLGGGTFIEICNSVHDADYIGAGGIVAAGLLAVLPLGKWSTTFRTDEGQPILILWTLLLAAGHVFFMLVMPNPNLNYQICPAGVNESLPAFGYNAGPHDAAWDASLQALINNETLVPQPGSLQCIYSCFALPNTYLGRLSTEIGVFDAGVSNRYTSRSFRFLGTAFWLIYALLAVAALITSKPHDDKHPKWLQLPSKTPAWLRKITLAEQRANSPTWCNFVVTPAHTCWQAITNNTVTNFIYTNLWQPFATRLTKWNQQGKDPAATHTKGFSAKCGICLLRRLTQVLSVCSYLGFVGFGYAEALMLPKSEPPAAVGQWGVIAAVVLTLVAACVIWCTTERKRSRLEEEEKGDTDGRDERNEKGVKAAWEDVEKGRFSTQSTIVESRSEARIGGHFL